MRSPAFATVTMVFLVTWLQGCAQQNPAGNAGLCADITCSGHGICAVSGGGKLLCACNAGYHAEQLSCIEDGSTGPCLNVTCSNHGTCVENGGQAQCLCESSYVADGLNCVSEEDPCIGVDCSGHGVCELVNEVATCACNPGYVAEALSCVEQDDPDPCAGVGCSGHGTCVVVDQAPTCACDSGYVADALSCVENTPPLPGVIEPTLQDIWDDTNVPFGSISNPAVPDGLVSSYSMYYAPEIRDYPDMSVEWTNPWYVVAQEAPVTSGGCELGMGTSVNTAVEIGTIRNWWLLADGTWYLAFEDSDNDGYNYPNPNDYFPGDLGCPTIDSNVRQPNSSYSVRKGLSGNGYRLSIPNYAFWDHGWPTQSILNIQNTVGQQVVAQLTQVFTRLVVFDSSGVDDRHLAKFVVNVGADKRYAPPNYGVYGDVGYSVTKRITNSWTATHMLTGGHFATYADFVASNPPLNVTP